VHDTSLRGVTVLFALLFVLIGLFGLGIFELTVRL
jgi:hypothetical protein